MINIFHFICIYLNYVLYSSTFFFGKLPEAYAFFNPIIDFMPVIPLFFSVSLCLASCSKFSMSSLL